MMPATGAQVEALVVVDKRVGARLAQRRWLGALASGSVATARVGANCVFLASVGPGVQRVRAALRQNRLADGDAPLARATSPSHALAFWWPASPPPSAHLLGV